MIDLSRCEIWFVTGSQSLYGADALETVRANSLGLVSSMNRSGQLPVPLVARPVSTDTEGIQTLCREADASDRCAGIIAWMHTFSPAQMWISGLKRLAKPVLHLHTQFYQDLPWDSIDMDFMNLHQSAHGDREFGFLLTRLGINRKVVVGHHSDAEVLSQIDSWTRAACAIADQQSLKIARFGDNMRNVAVTEGDKTEAQIQFGYSVQGYGIGDLVACISTISDSEINTLVSEYHSLYTVNPQMGPGGAKHESLREAARIECGLRKFLLEGGFGAFTDTFENLHGLRQLPGIAVQRLMADGYGFGAEGDWKTAALVRAFKVMAHGLSDGVSFMEDYTYHLNPAGRLVLGAHMLEICPSITRDRPSCEVHPLGIGNREDPVRLVFTARSGPAVNVSVVDLGDRFRMIANKVEAVEPPFDLPELPVARAVWKPQPDLRTAAAAWIYSGGSHHTVYAPALTMEHVRDFAEMLGVECVVIDESSTVASVRDTLRWNEAYYSQRR